MIWTSFSQALLVSSPWTASSLNCAKSLASAMQPGLRPSPMEMAMSYSRQMSKMSSQCSYAKFSLWSIRASLAWMEPPLETIPVTLLAV